VEVLFLLLFVSFLLAVGFLVVFLLAIRRGEYDDMEGPPVRLFIDETPKK